LNVCAAYKKPTTTAQLVPIVSGSTHALQDLPAYLRHLGAFAFFVFLVSVPFAVKNPANPKIL